MSVIAMKCIEKAIHPNADKLNVYKFTDNNRVYEIIANNENNYDINNVAAIVLGGLLKDGVTFIQPTNVRGVISYGMALGKVDVPIGTDLSDQYLIPQDNTSNVFIAWPDIEQLYNIRRYISEGKLPGGKIKYLKKIKLDGTNAGVQVLPNGKFSCQSRSQIITTESDNLGFARWAVSNKDIWEDVSKKIATRTSIFGEWAGIGIQKRCSISQINKKVFAIFAVLQDNKYIVDPEKIKKIIPETEDIKVISWYGESIEIDYTSLTTTNDSADPINKMVEEVEACDPWVKEVFGVEGMGEGLVFYPVLDDSGIIDKVYYDNYVFKAKGEKHQVVKNKKPAQAEPEKVDDVNAFVDLFVTDQRLDQFVQKIGLDQKKVGEFLKAFCADVEKESSAELAVAGLKWADVGKAVGNQARKWYLNKLKVS
jgi:tRNA-binding EMAP/Myf-like protein